MKVIESLIGYTLEIEDEEEEYFISYLKDYVDIRETLNPNVYKVYIN